MEDRERRLIARGQEDVPRVGRYMAKHGYQPDLVLCSSAQRTMQTLELLVPELARPAPKEALDALYLAEPEVLLAHIRRAPNAAKVLLLIGHNPGLEQLAWQLSRTPVKRKTQDLMDQMEEKFPTCALAVLDFPVQHWSGVWEKGGTLIDFVRPKDLR